MGRIPNMDNLNYSDHEGVYGEFQIKDSHSGIFRLNLRKLDFIFKRKFLRKE